MLPNLFVAVDDSRRSQYSPAVVSAHAAHPIVTSKFPAPAPLVLRMLSRLMSSPDRDIDAFGAAAFDLG